MELINNTTKTLRDDLSVEIKEGSKLSITAACFSIYAFQELKKQLSDIDELRFIFTSPTFITEKAKKEKREFYIPRLNRERSLYGTEFEIKLRNELTQKAIAKECAEWIKKKVSFKSNISDKTIQGGIVVDDVGYTPINNFTTIELGCEKGNVISTTIVKDNSLAKTLLTDFNEIWNDNKVLQEVTDEVIDSITAAYNENSPDFIYFVTLYNIFNEFLEDVSEDVLPNEATGFKDSKIWSMLYNFQKDAALAIINKLEKYNGCILADSVGLGKTFTALAVIKYYENRNKSVLVLCPKKLTNNWNTYKDNYVNNPIASDRLRYDVLYHTDLNRTHGKSNGLDLDRLNWGKDSADLGKKIAEKRKKRSDAYLKLQKEQQNEQKKQDRASQRLQASYENRIDELQRQLAKSVVLPQQNNSESEEEYDVFVSHAWEDKEGFVDEFVDELKKQGLKVWYDTNKLKWGDSMREKIDKGLAKSRYGVVVLSPNYIAEHKYWTKAELNGLFQVESINGKVILPIWHNLTKKQIVEYSPIIADRKAMTTASMTAEEIAVQLKELFTPEVTEEN